MSEAVLFDCESTSRKIFVANSNRSLLYSLNWFDRLQLQFPCRHWVRRCEFNERDEMSSSSSFLKAITSRSSQITTISNSRKVEAASFIYLIDCLHLIISFRRIIHLDSSILLSFDRSFNLIFQEAIHRIQQPNNQPVRVRERESQISSWNVVYMKREKSFINKLPDWARQAS